MLSVFLIGNVIDGGEKNGIIAFDEVNSPCSYAELSHTLIEAVAPDLTVKIRSLFNTFKSLLKDTLFVLFKQSNGNMVVIGKLLLPCVTDYMKITFIKVKGFDLSAADLENAYSVIHTVEQPEKQIRAAIGGYYYLRIGNIGNTLIHNANAAPVLVDLPYRLLRIL